MYYPVPEISFKAGVYLTLTKQLNDYIIWYNTKRIKKSLGYMSPIDYRKSLGLSY